MNTTLLTGIVLVAVLLISFLSLALYFQNKNKTGNLPPIVNFSWSTLQANTTQDGSVCINCTVFNASKQPVNNEAFDIQLASINNVSYWAKGSIWNTVFDQTFTPKTLSLNPHEQKTTVLTITMAENASIGKYEFALQGGNDLLLTVTAKP